MTIIYIIDDFKNAENSVSNKINENISLKTLKNYSLHYVTFEVQDVLYNFIEST